MTPNERRPVTPTASGGLLRRYRSGTSVSTLAKDLGVSFDSVAQRVIAAGIRRDRPSQRGRPLPIELDSDEWLGEQLAGGAGVRDLSRRLHVTPSTVRKALRGFVARRGDGSDTDGVGRGESDPVRRFAAATKRVERASGALERARRLQASAVKELHRSGLTIAAIADRLDADEHLVETLLTTDPADDGP